MKTLCSILLLFSTLLASAQKDKLTTSHFVFDGEKIFTPKQIHHYDSLIGSFAARTSYNICIISTDTVGADQFKFLNEFQYWNVENWDSLKVVIILLSRKQREYSVNATGNMASILTDEVINRLVAPAIPELKNDHYFEAVLITCGEIFRFLEEIDPPRKN